MIKDRIVQKTTSISSSLKLRTRLVGWLKAIALFILLFIFFLNTSLCQEIKADTTQLQSSEKTQPGLKKNAIYVSGGTIGSSYSFINGNYERMVWGNKDPVFRSLFIRLSIGRYAGETLTGFISFSSFKATTYMATIGGLVGKRSSFLEFAAGFMYSTGTENGTSGWTGKADTSTYTEAFPAITLGYRYQQPGGHFLFRVGGGFYEIYYISLGFCL